MPQIAKIFDKSKRTIETQVDKLKYKFSCKNKSDLIQTAIEQGYTQSVSFFGFIAQKFFVKIVI